MSSASSSSLELSLAPPSKVVFGLFPGSLDIARLIANRNALGTPTGMMKIRTTDMTVVRINVPLSQCIPAE